MTKLRPALPLMALLACSFSGCARSSRPAFGGETNWLRHCQANKDCTAPGSCVCGLCSKRCAQDSDCGTGMLCQPGDSALVSNACGVGNEPGLCSPQCKHDSDCTGRQTCLEHACVPEPATASRVADASSARPGATDASTATATGTPAAADASADADALRPAGPGAAGVGTVPVAIQGRTPQAYVLSALVPDSSCVYSSDNATMQVGLLDIASGGAGSGGRCARTYRLHLKIASDEPSVLQFSGATITLMSSKQETILFDRMNPPLPNPFMYLASMTLLPATGGATARGIFEVEVVPPSYAHQLDAFSGAEILAVISLQALDANDAPVTFRPFTYPITICIGCLSVCTSALPSGTTRNDIVGNKCDDNSGSDGRICFDPDC